MATHRTWELDYDVVKENSRGDTIRILCLGYHRDPRLTFWMCIGDDPTLVEMGTYAQFRVQGNRPLFLIRILPDDCIIFRCFMMVDSWLPVPGQSFAPDGTPMSDEEWNRHCLLAGYSTEGTPLLLAEDVGLRADTQ